VFWSSSISCPTFRIDVSSAYINVLPCVRCGISFIYKVNSNGPRTDHVRGEEVMRKKFCSPCGIHAQEIVSFIVIDLINWLLWMYYKNTVVCLPA
jgi:hypothetical protein